MMLNDLQKKYIEDRLTRLARSKFRNGFVLREKEINYLNDKGLNIVESHAFDFVKNRLGDEKILNDGKQTPMRGHPVFIAQHATATCCRGCLCKWHNIKKNKKLSEKEINFIVSLIMEWIKKNSRLDKDKYGVEEM